MLLGLLVGAMVFFALCYRLYGGYMSRIYGLSDSNKTPAEAMYDGVDYCPAHPAVLLGHHFSSIAGAGPIVGPITAAGMFGWLPTYLWCVIGSAFLGGPHDMGGLVSSMRHEGKSVGEVVDRWIGRAGKVLFLCFTILTLILVVAVFLQLSASSFASDPAVAFAATLYIFMALIFGLLIYRMNCPLWLMTIIMVPIIIYACWFGNGNQWISRYFSLSGNPVLEFHQAGIDMPLADAAAFDKAKTKNAEAVAAYADFDAYKAAREARFQELKATDEVLQKSGAASYEEFAKAQKALAVKNMENWRWVLVVYIILASVMPVWLLLQPRDYLASYFLYFAVIIGTIGMVLGSSKFTVELPAFKGFVAGNNYLWPMLFIIVACGALSGFHSLVGSGTTSKQIRREKDSVLVGYGSMLIEGLVAVIALGTIMISGELLGNPNNTYATGFGRFAALIGIDPKIGKSLGLLALNSFLLTSLDTATRLTRYQIQELTNMKVDRYTATFIAVAAAMGLLLTKTHTVTGAAIPVWQAIWPVFGAANQLVGALVLLALAVWVARALKKPNKWLMIPMWFMLITTVAALGLMVRDNLINAAKPNWVLGGMAILLLVLALLMVLQAFSALNRRDGTPLSHAGD
ncbi:MAG: carbon starvation CstA family protein [Fretibacterium sp.]|nr:carbon starvation CstA family protein [Fretibacterium sp.]